MKKTLVFLFFLLVFTIATQRTVAQQTTEYSISALIESDRLPFERYISFTAEDFRADGFAYDKAKNLFKIKNYSKNTKMIRFFWEDIRNNGDYEMFVYLNKDRPALIHIYFYDPIVYQSIKEWIRRKEIRNHNVGERETEMTEFKYDSLTVFLSKSQRKYYNKVNEMSFFSAFSSSGSGGFSPILGGSTSYRRSSYPVYCYTIALPEGPQSEWFSKQLTKQAKKKSKGKLKPQLTERL